MSTKYTHIFEPIQLGRTLFRNRIFSSPQDIPRLTAENFLTSEAVAFYEMKARGGFASVCIGDCMVDSETAHSHPFQMRGDDVRGKAHLTSAASAITSHGAIASIELVHGGMNAHEMAKKCGFIWGPNDDVIGGVPIKAMDEEQIEKFIGYYADMAAFARMCGFGMVTIHGGHGWALTQFMSPRDNHRTDRWGGSLENRMRLPLAVVEGIRKRVGNAFPIEFRMSGAECVPGGYDIDEGVRMAQLLDGKVDLIHVSAGHHEIDSAAMITHPTMFLPDGCNLKYAAEIKKHVKSPVATVGAFTDPAMVEDVIASGKADVVQMGRQTLADPDWPIKAKSGKEDEIVKCLRCFTCFSCSTNCGVYYCSVNPVIGHELESMNAPKTAAVKKKVLVAGGGIAGMQAAITAAEQGHKVILCEKSDHLGGVLMCEENIPFKQHLKEYLARQARCVTRRGVEVHLNTEVTPELAKGFNADVIFAALGSRPMKPPIPGIDGKNVVGAEDVYYHPELAGKNVVIMGGGLVGVELGIFLAQNGRDVTIVEMQSSVIAVPQSANTSDRMGQKASLNFGEPFVHGIALSEMIKSLPNMRIFLSTRALEVTSEGLRVEGPEGERVIPAETVIYALGQRSLQAEALALSDCAPEFHMLGDCSTPRNILTSTQAAWQIANDIGRM